MTNVKYPKLFAFGENVQFGFQNKSIYADGWEKLLSFCSLHVKIFKSLNRSTITETCVDDKCHISVLKTLNHYWKPWLL